MFCPCSENKGADQLRGSAKLICAFVFAQAFCLFSYAVAQFFFLRSNSIMVLYPTGDLLQHLN